MTVAAAAAEVGGGREGGGGVRMRDRHSVEKRKEEPVCVFVSSFGLCVL